MGAIEDIISQCPFLQMTYTAENQHADGSASPGAHPRYRPPCHRDLHVTSRTHDNRMAGIQTSCPQQTAPPQPRCSKDVTVHQCRPGARPGRPCPVPDVLAITHNCDSPVCNHRCPRCCYTRGDMTSLLRSNSSPS
jgi:hypothetical protein